MQLERPYLNQRVLRGRTLSGKQDKELVELGQVKQLADLLRIVTKLDLAHFEIRFQERTIF